MVCQTQYRHKLYFALIVLLLTGFIVFATENNDSSINEKISLSEGDSTKSEKSDESEITFAPKDDAQENDTIELNTSQKKSSLPDYGFTLQGEISTRGLYLFKFQFDRIININKYCAFSLYAGMTLNWFADINNRVSNDMNLGKILICILLVGLPLPFYYASECYDLFYEGFEFRYYPYRNKYFTCFASVGLENNPGKLSQLCLKYNKENNDIVNLVIPIKVQVEGNLSIVRLALFGKFNIEPMMPQVISKYTMSTGSYNDGSDYKESDFSLCDWSAGISFGFVW